jgi:hypothetical protein
MLTSQNIKKENPKILLIHGSLCKSLKLFFGQKYAMQEMEYSETLVHLSEGTVENKK